MAGGIVLKADQKYAAGFSYGAADWVEEGTWKWEGDAVVLSGGHFKMKTFPDVPRMLPSGTKFSYQDGRLVSLNGERDLEFIDPNKTPSRRKTTGQAGEGRMLVQGRVIKIDSGTMVVKIKDECIRFAVAGLSSEVIKAAGKGATLDVEIPYSAISGSGSCPPE
jgi:hypothetical protein